MLPYKKNRGKRGYKNLKVFLGVPKEFKGIETQIISDVNAERLRCPYITVGELAKVIGWKPAGAQNVKIN